MNKFFHQAIAALVACLALTIATPDASAVIIGSTEVPLDARNTTVRYVESNVGNLVADAIALQAFNSGLNPTIGFVNGGGIRTNSLNYPGATPGTPADITDLEVFSLLPFSNSVVVIENVSIPDLLLALENSVSNSATIVEGPAGRFLQISSGLVFSWNDLAPTGSRIIDVMLNGIPLIDDGVVRSSMLLNIATIDFLAIGGDGYSMFPGTYNVSNSGVLDRVALTNFIQSLPSARITAADYPVGGEGRILRGAQLFSVPEPGTLALLGLGLAGLAASRRRRQ